MTRQLQADRRKRKFSFFANALLKEKKERGQPSLNFLSGFLCLASFSTFASRAFLFVEKITNKSRTPFGKLAKELNSARKTKTPAKKFSFAPASWTMACILTAFLTLDCFAQQPQTPTFQNFQPVNTSPALNNNAPANNNSTIHRQNTSTYYKENEPIANNAKTEKKYNYDAVKCNPNIKDIYYEQAYQEIKKMLTGEIKPSFKRAVFLTENALKGGTLDYEEFCKEIDEIVVKLKQMVSKKGVGQYKTGFNWAIFTYMSDSIPENNFHPYTYDYENFFGEKDFESFLVTSLLKRKLGNCHSLPYLYKILADEVGAEAYIAIAPMHCFIRHQDEQGKWWNLEMTSGSFSRTSFIIEQFNISTKAIETGLYMKPLEIKETLVLCMEDMLDYYEKKYGVYADTFVKKNYEVGIKYFPNSLMQLTKADEIKFRLDCKMGEKGIFNYDKIQPYPELVALKDEYEKTRKYIKDMGYEKFPEEKYKQMVKEIQEEKQKKSNQK